MAIEFPELVFNDEDDFDADRLNAAMRVLDARLRTQEGLKISFEDAVDTLNRYGLIRLNEAVQPVYDRLIAIGRIGVIFQAPSTTPSALTLGLKTFVVSEDRRQTFAPAAYLQIRSTSNPSKALYGATQSYNADTGELTILVDQANGSAADGTITNWTISAGATPDFASSASALGVYSQAQVDQRIADAITALKGGAPADRATLAAVNNALNALTDGAVNIKNFAQVSTAIANRLQVDSPQGLNDTAKRQGLTNLGVSDFMRGLLGSLDLASTQQALGIVQTAITFAAAADILANVADRTATPNAIWGALAPVTWNYQASITPNMATFLNATMTLSGNLTVANPSNAKAGQAGEIVLIQDGNGNRTVAFGSAWKFIGGAPTASTAPNSIDVVSYRVISATQIVCSYGKAASS